MNFTFVDLYPTRIWSLQPDSLLTHHPQWLQAIHNLRRQHPTPQGRSSRAAWNSDTTLLNDPLFSPLKATLLTAVSSILRHHYQYTTNQTASLVAWANVHDLGGFNTQHLHPNNTFSGVYYLSVPRGAGPIVFRDPRYAACMSPIGPVEESSITPQVGQLLIFPSWLEHRVEINQAESPRVSIAFNVGLR